MNPTPKFHTIDSIQILTIFLMFQICSFQDGYEYATADQIEFERCSNDDVAADRTEQPPSSENHSNYRKISRDGTITFNCDECDKSFTYSIALKRHKQIVHRDSRSYKCVKCDINYTSFSIFSEHLQSAHELFGCDRCDKAFHYPSNLELHKLRVHVDRQPHTYNIHCPKKCFSKQSLQYRRNTHTDEESHACDKCENKSFSSLSNLMAHKIRNHQNVIRHNCPVCARKFTYIYNLNYHLRSHIVQKSYASSLQMENIGKVYKASTKKLIRSLVCKMCNRTFADGPDVQIHIDDHHTTTEISEFLHKNV